MKCAGVCKCGSVAVEVAADVSASDLNPRVCDCDYCQEFSAGVISHPSKDIKVNRTRAHFVVEQNGDKLARFCRCPRC